MLCDVYIMEVHHGVMPNTCASLNRLACCHYKQFHVTKPCGCREQNLPCTPSYFMYEGHTYVHKDGLEKAFLRNSTLLYQLNNASCITHA